MPLDVASVVVDEATDEVEVARVELRTVEVEPVVNTAVEDELSDVLVATSEEELDVADKLVLASEVVVLGATEEVVVTSDEVDDTEEELGVVSDELVCTAEEVTGVFVVLSLLEDELAVCDELGYTG
ncbi:hypothetical protein H2203_006960 [Taxawa tesnikishii (nom. ined.)]|nr:hypothetical protein H2203_006960 [Dothideales sp. JES 119]